MNTIIEQIDQDKSQYIELREIEEALRSDGILSKEENIKKLVDELNSDENFEGLSESLKYSLNNAIENILSNKKWKEDEILIINLRFSLYREEELTQREKIEKKISDDVSAIVKSYVFDSEQKNRIGGQYQYKREEIELVQLLANIKQANVEIDGERAFVSRQGNKIPTLSFDLYIKSSKEAKENSWITNIWIYREELKRLFGDEIDNTPTNFFEEKLGELSDIEKQNKVLAKFGEDTKKIRTHGSYYSKNQKEALKYYFELLVEIELTIDEVEKKGKEKEATEKFKNIASDVQDFVNEDKVFFIYNNLQRIDITEYTKTVGGFKQGTSEKDIEKMLIFLGNEENTKYIHSNYPEFKEYIYEAVFTESQKNNSIISQEFLTRLKQEYPDVKLFINTKTKENKENLDYLHIKQRKDTIILIATKFFEYLEAMNVNGDKFHRYFVQTKEKLNTFQEKDHFGKDKGYFNYDINLLIEDIFFRTSGQNAAKTNAIYSMLYNTEGLGTYPNYSLLGSVNIGVDKIKNMLQGKEKGFEERWKDENKIKKMMIEVDVIWGNRDKKNELIFKKLTHGEIYVENNISGVFDNMQEQDEKKYQHLYERKKEIDVATIDAISKIDRIEDQEIIVKLKEISNLKEKIDNYSPYLDPRGKTPIENELYVKIREMASLLKNKGIDTSILSISFLAKSYVETENIMKGSIDEKIKELRENSIVLLKNEQQKIKDKWSNFDPEYATPESTNLYNEEYGRACLILEVIEKGQVTVDEENFTIKDFISDEMIVNSLKIQHMLTMELFLKKSMYKLLVTSSDPGIKSDLVKLENTPMEDRTIFEKQMYMMNDTLGGGSFWNFSDGTLNTISTVAETLIVQGAMIAISGGIASVGATLLTRGLSIIPSVARALTHVMVYSKAGLGLKNARLASRGLTLLGKGIQIVSLTTEGILFHAGSTTLSGTYEGQTWDQIVESLSFGNIYQRDLEGNIVIDEETKLPIILNKGRKEYLHSTGFLGVMKAFAPIANRLNIKYNSTLPKDATIWKRTTNALKAEAATLPGEIAGMLATEKTLNILLDQKLEGINGESFLNTITIIIGLRVAHRYLPPFHNIKAKIDQKTFETGASKISSSDVNKVISEIGFSESAIFINKEMSGKKSKITDEGWDFAIKGKDGKIIFYNERGEPVLGVEVEDFQTKGNSKESVVKVIDKENKAIEVDWSKVLQKSFNEKLDINKIEVPMKDGKLEYKFYDSNGKEIKISEETTKSNELKRMLIELFEKSIGEDVDLRGNENYVLKTPYGFSLDLKLIGDMDYATNPQGMKSFLYNLREKKGQIKNFELTGNVEQKTKIEWIKGIDDLFTKDGKLKGEIEKMIDNGIEINGVKQKIRISYDYLIDLKGSEGITKGSINREIFIERGDKLFEIDPTKEFMYIETGGKSIKILDPLNYKEYCLDLLYSEATKEIGEGIDKIDKTKISKRINDYIDTLTIIDKYKKQDIFEGTLEVVRKSVVESQIEKSRVKVFLDGLTESIEIRRNQNPEDPTIDGLEKLSDITNQAIKAHEGLNKNDTLKSLPNNISDFMSKTSLARKYVIGYNKTNILLEFLKKNNLSEIKENYPNYIETFMEEPFFDEYVKMKTGATDKVNIEQNKNEIMKDIKKLEEMRSELGEYYKRSIKELSGYDYYGEDGFSYFLDYYIVTNVEKYQIMEIQSSTTFIKDKNKFYTLENSESNSKVLENSKFMDGGINY